MNPEAIQLDDANPVAQWDFTQQSQLAAWSKCHHLKVEQRDAGVLLVSTGQDPQIETQLAQPVEGNLVVQLEARPTTKVDVEFFWAGSGGDYRASQANGRELDAVEQMQPYLFRIGDGTSVDKLRFDPLRNTGELRVRSITLFRLPAQQE